MCPKRKWLYFYFADNLYNRHYSVNMNCVTLYHTKIKRNVFLFIFKVYLVRTFLCVIIERENEEGG